MGKRRMTRRKGSPDESIFFLTEVKRPKLNPTKTRLAKDKDIIHIELDESSDTRNLPSTSIEVKQSDKTEERVEFIIEDVKKNNRNTLTLFGSGLGIEKTIAVVEALKLSYTKKRVQYSQKSTIRYSDDQQPHLQVILTLSGSTNPDANDSTQTEVSSRKQTDTDSMDEILIPTK